MNVAENSMEYEVVSKSFRTESMKKYKNNNNNTKVYCGKTH